MYAAPCVFGCGVAGSLCCTFDDLDFFGRQAVEGIHRLVYLSLLRAAFRPEFLNRVDETVLFKPLSLEEIESIVDLLIADVNLRLADKRVTVSLDPKAKEWVAEKGYDPVFGARPLKRFLQRHLETRLARALIAGEVGEDSTVTCKVQGDELVLT